MNRRLVFGIIIFIVIVAANFLPFKSTSPLPSPSPTVTNSAALRFPTITSPKKGTAIKSPATITGVVPPGWMSEGTFPLILKDNKGVVLVEASAKEVTPGSWSSGQSVAFTATLTFKTKALSGTLVLKNDNPSGKPENSASYELPVLFKQ